MIDTTVDRYRARTSRRLRYRSRSVAASVALVALALVAAYLGTEAVLAVIGRPAIVSDPFALPAFLDQNPAIAVTASIVLAVLGIISVVAALTPGRFRRRVIADDRAIVVIDDDVVASGVSRRVAGELGVARTQVRTSLGRRRADIRVTPTTGFALSAPPARDAAARLIDQLALRPTPAMHADIERTGVIG